MPKREYVITDGVKFVKQNTSGQYRYITNAAIADAWDNPSLADAVLHNALPKATRNDFYIAFWNGKVYEKCSLSDSERTERRNSIMTDSDKAYSMSLYSFDNDSDVQNIIEGFTRVRSSFYNNKNRNLSLEKELCKLDLMDEDIKHYLGRKKINASNGYKLSKARQEIVLKRVSIKNQIELIKKINKHYDEVLSALDDILSTVGELKNQSYKPRILVELFEEDKLDLLL